MRNHSGPRSSKRRLLAGVVSSIMRYAAPVWHAGLATKSYRLRLESAQRIVARRVGYTFRLVRYWSAILVAGIIPISLQVEEDARVYHRLRATDLPIEAAAVRQEERRTTLDRWQARWDATIAVGSPENSRFTRWAHRVIPSVDHGSRATGLPADPVDTMEHAAFQCSRFVAERAALLAHDGAPAVTADNLVEQLLHSPARWKTISELARRIMTVRQRRWQQDQATEAAETAAASAAEVAEAAEAVADAEAASAVAATAAETVQLLPEGTASLTIGR
uniref:Uncharacterized protein n=1 Tax=Anopheles atroparvus TaxID=41427 RepID=A0A182JHP7_ANOAO